MPDAAHPQLEDTDRPAEAAEEAGAEPENVLAGNPFPDRMTVPGPGGEPVVLELAVADGLVYAPGADSADLTPQVRQYVLAYCAAWSSSVVTTARIGQAPELPRWAQIALERSQLHAMLGLAADEKLLQVVADNLTGRVRFVVESPRLPAMMLFDSEPPPVSLPLALYYENQGVRTVPWPGA